MSDVLGLDRSMREAYHLLLQGNVSTAARMTERLGISRAQGDRVVARLVAAGLAAASPEDPSRLIPLDPRRGLGPSIARRQAKLLAQQHELSRSQEAFAALVAAYTAYDGSRATAPDELSRSGAAVRGRVEDMLAASRSAVMCILAEGARGIALGVSPAAIEKAIDRGVSVRAIYAGSILADDAGRAHARWLVSRGGSARTTPSLPPAMLVVDRMTAIVPAEPSAAAAFVVHNRALAAALSELFDHVWGEARLAAPAPAQVRADAPTPQERDLLRLLGRGMTDASAARQLGVSLRTVRRMMAELMTRLDARSRFEAGLRAAERGWVSGSDATSLRRRPGSSTGSGAPAAMNG
ncbi:LuxR C-terminal-related transcriptional regulator [Actinopolymorpha sp. B9G3]|uniref:helix-turn-helix transcriptional regulator n=1 Tax=Actinopolymorpha sp. B9G3 TaxID=3158970 RepID=UPI0032D99AB8